MNKIMRRYYVAVKLKLRSPLSVANGEDQYTDSDLLRSAGGEVFLPGTSIAGAFRAYIGQRKDDDGLMGFSRQKEGRMSALFIEDAYFEEPKVSVRDGVRLEDRIVKDGGKFDFEIIETGARTTLYLEYVKREKDTEDGLALIAQMIWGMENGEICFGARKNRGLGSVEVEQVYKADFGSEQREEWLSFCQEKQKPMHLWKDWKTLVKLESDKYVTISIPLELKGGISIRKYSAEPDKADFEHITCNEEPVIPGSSWNGAIRARINEILAELGCGCKQRKKLMDNWFGYVKEDEEEKEKEKTNKEQQKKACQSMISFGESILEGWTRLAATRNKINRFDASAVKGGLYTEISYFGGTASLQIRIRKKDGWKELVGILFWVIDEIREGYLAIGGQTAVGRGIFAGNGDLVVEPKGVIDRTEALSLLSQCIK